MKTPTIKSLAIAAAAVSMLAACATATPYGPAGTDGRPGGYTDQRIDANRYLVSFSGNSLTSRSQVEMGLLLRAAELTSQNGYSWFATVNRATERDTSYRSTPEFNSPAYGPFSYGPYWGPNWRFYSRGNWNNWGPFWGNNVDIRQVDKYEASAEIIMGHGAKPADNPNAFDAAEVISNLRTRVTMPSTN